MEPFKKHTGLVVPIGRANIDTDAIIPKQFLRKIERAGFGKHLFHDWRYLDDAETKPNPDFLLNKPQYQNATILLARDNFGCGSSREHAVWALSDYGFKVIIAPSFADIFYNNAIKNGILLVKIASDVIDALFSHATKGDGSKITADLENQVIIDPNGDTYQFDIDPFAKECLLKGLDGIGLTEQCLNKIEGYEKKQKTKHPWM